MGQTGDRILSSHITNAHCYQERAKHGQSVPTLFVNAPFFGIFCINALPLSHSCVHYILGKLRLLCFLSFDANINTKTNIKWVSSRQNLSWGFSTKPD